MVSSIKTPKEGSRKPITSSSTKRCACLFARARVTVQRCRLETGRTENGLTQCSRKPSFGRANSTRSSPPSLSVWCAHSSHVAAKHSLLGQIQHDPLLSLSFSLSLLVCPLTTSEPSSRLVRRQHSQHPVSEVQMRYKICVFGTKRGG